MKPGTGSRTALATARMRAAHQLLDAKPPLIEDPVAVPLVGPEAVRVIREAAARHRTPGAMALRSHVLLRSAFAEDRLSTAARRGVSQYVVLGAGFDTFALRQPSWARGLKVFEIDHPATQELKWGHAARAGLQWPANVVLAPVDLERESLLDVLARHGISPREPTFFSWLGVTMYLPQPAMDSALRSMATFPSGSEVVLTFLPRADDASEAQRLLAARVAAAGEAFVSRLDPREMEATLRMAGFSKAEFLSPHDAEARYYAPRPRDLPVPAQTGIVAATR